MTHFDWSNNGTVVYGDSNVTAWLSSHYTWGSNCTDVYSDSNVTAWLSSHYYWGNNGTVVDDDSMYALNSTLSAYDAFLGRHDWGVSDFSDFANHTDIPAVKSTCLSSIMVTYINARGTPTFLGAFGYTGAGTNETTQSTWSPFGGRVVRITMSTCTAFSGTVTVVFRVNGSNSSLSCSLHSGVNAETVGTVSFVQYDCLTFGIYTDYSSTKYSYPWSIGVVFEVDA